MTRKSATDASKVFRETATNAPPAETAADGANLAALTRNATIYVSQQFIVPGFQPSAPSADPEHRFEVVPVHALMREWTV